MTAMRTSMLLVALVLLAGCGGRSATRPVVSPRAFADKANGICRSAATPAERVTRLRRLRPPLAAKELLGHWLKAETAALAAYEALSDPQHEIEGDPLVPLVIAEGKVEGYAARLGARVCEVVPTVTMSR